MDEEKLVMLFFDKTLLDTGRFKDVLSWLYCSVNGIELNFDPLKYDWIGESRVDSYLGNIEVFLNVVENFKDYTADINGWHNGEYRVPALTLESYITELLISDVKLVRATCESWLKGELPQDFDEPVKMVLCKYLADSSYLDIPTILTSHKPNKGRPSTPFDQLLNRLKVYCDTVQEETLNESDHGVSSAAKELGIDGKAFRNSMKALLGSSWKDIIINPDHEYHFLVREVISRLD